MEKVRQILHVYENFPSEGVTFVDMPDILADPEAMRTVVDGLKDKIAADRIDVVCGLESRGFYFGIPLAMALGVPFVPIHKPNKLPGAVERAEYRKIYGADIMEVQKNRFRPGARVVVLDDAMASGGSLRTACELLQKCGCEVVAALCVVEFPALNGRQNLPPGVAFHSLLSY